jgi:hypothetical protein
MLAVIYIFSISVAAAVLFVAVNEFEPDRFLRLGPQVRHRLCERGGSRGKTDALIASWGCSPANNWVSKLAKDQRHE